MLKTKYFYSYNTYSQGNIAINQITSKKDKFIEENKLNIAKIVDEDIKIAGVGNGNYVIFILKLTYYSK